MELDKETEEFRRTISIGVAKIVDGKKEEALKDADIIAADPMYRPICPKKCEFYELPHLAFPGRIYKKKLEKIEDFWKY